MINSRKVLSRQFNIGVDVSFFELWPWLHPQKAYLSPTTHTEPLQLIEINYRILLPKKTQASQDMVCSRNLDSPNQPEAEETQFTLVPIPKKIRQYILS